MNPSQPAHTPPDPTGDQVSADPFAEARPLDGSFESDSDHESLRAAGAVVLRAGSAGPTEVALLKRQGTVCLPRVLIHSGEATRAAAQRAIQDQVQPDIDCEDWRYLTQLRAEVSGTPLATDYWRATAHGSSHSLHPDCFWSPLAQAAEQLDFPEERHYLSTMEAP